MAEMVNYLHCTTAATYTAATGAGSHTKLMSVNVGTSNAGATIKIYDGDATSGTLVANIDASAKGSYWYGGIRLTKGITVVVASATIDATIGYI